MKGLKDITHEMKSSFKLYCVIGDPINHSLSPLMHNSAFKFLKINSTYISYRIPKKELKSGIETLRDINISGFNVTLPHKIAIMKYLDQLDESAIRSGAVNTVQNLGGKFMGYNTDVYGFIQPLHKRKINLMNMNILILGAGGAAYAIVTSLSYEKGISEVTILNRSQDRGLDLVKHGLNLGLNCKFQKLSDLSNLTLKYDLIVNASSIGLKNEVSPISTKYIEKDSIVYEIVYRPIYTNLVLNAKKVNARIIYGYEMLVEQGAKAFEIWTGSKAPIKTMKQSLLGVFGEPK